MKLDLWKHLHELQDRLQMIEGNVLQDDYGMFWWILFKEGFEVRTAGR